MKTLIFAAALMLGTASIAQDTNTTDTMQDTTQPSGETVDDPSQRTGPEGVTQQGTDPNGMATPPAGTNQAPMTNDRMMAPAPQSGMMSNMPAPQQAMGEYPPCSKTVTDRCTQTYERGMRRSRRR